MLKWIRDKYDDWKFEKEFQALLPEGVSHILQEAVLSGVFIAFITVFIVSLFSLGFTILLPKGRLKN